MSYKREFRKVPEGTVDFMTANLMYGAGVDIKTNGKYSLEELQGGEIRIFEYYESNYPYKNGDFILAPTQTQLHDYLIEKHGYYIVVIPTVTSHWTFKSVKVISEVDNDVISGLISVSDLPPYKEVNGTDYPTHTEALEAGLQEVLKQIIKTK